LINCGLIYQSLRALSSELESDICYRVYGLRHLVKATEVTTGLENNGNLPLGG